jgi:3-oxoacyl-[acyl-carrier-protein] synthase-3
MNHAFVKGTGSYLPTRQVTNAELSTTMDTSDEWIYSRTGIRSRHVASALETTSFMASEAAKKAMEASELTSDDIDMIIVATCTPDHFFPSVACAVQHVLGIRKPIPAFDMSAACSGFVYAMDVAKQYIASGAAQHILVVGSERMSKAVDWADRTTCVLFGDGAGAVVLSAGQTPGIIGSVLHAQYDTEQLLGYRNFLQQDQKPLITMRGNETFKMAVNIMGEIVDEVLKASHLDKSDINWLIPHQANIRIIQAIAKKLLLPMSRVIVTIEHQGNTSAASIPLALDYAVKMDQVKRGDLLLLEAFGGGITWGAMVLRY